MRLNAYKQAIDEARELPLFNAAFWGYFNDKYSPQKAAINHIMKKARLDIGALHSGEYVELYNYVISGKTN